MLGEPFRLPPAGAPGQYRTFGVDLPDVPDVLQPASCEDVDCPAWANGWETRLPADSPLNDTVRGAGRPYTARTEGAELVYLFPAGTPCFQASQHRTRTGHPGLFVVREGDWRGNPRGTPARVHARPDDWVEDLAGHTEAVRDRIEKG